MSDKNKNNIFYKPELDYEKSYETEGRINSSIIGENNQVSENIIDEFNNTINKINNILNLFPDDLKETASNPLKIIQVIIGEIPKNIEDINDIEEVININPNINKIKEDVYPENPFDDDDEFITITVTNNDKVDIIKNKYYYDLASVIDDYINKLNDSVNTCISNILISFKNIDISFFDTLMTPYKIPTEKISKDYKHLSDSILRSQINRNMKQRLYAKLYDIDKTINHIRNCKAGVEQRIRYYEEDYINDNDFNEAISNKILGQSRIIYDKKYKQNFFNLYKYLNSSVILLNECFNMYLSEAQAKIILKEKGEDI